MRPEVLSPLAFHCREEEEVLQLCEAHKRGCRNYIHPENLGQAPLVKVEWILGRQKPFPIAVKGSCIVYYVYLFRRPPTRDI